MYVLFVHERLVVVIRAGASKSDSYKTNNRNQEIPDPLVPALRSSRITPGETLILGSPHIHADPQNLQPCRLYEYIYEKLAGTSLVDDANSHVVGQQLTSSEEI